MAIAHRTEVRIYDRTGTGSYTALPVSGLSFSTALGGGGFCSFEVDARQADIAAAPDMLDDCVIKLAIPLDGTDTAGEVLAYANRARNGILWDGAGRQVRQVRTAPSLWTAWAQDAILHTEANTIPQMAGEQRWFGFQSSIYDFTSDPDYTWSGSPNEVVQQGSSTGDRAGMPVDWPADLDHAYWITRPTPSNGMRHLFVADCVVPADAYITMWFSADESCSVYFAGELAIQTSSSETGYQDLHEWSAYVTAGTYRVAIDKTSIVSRGGDGVDPVCLAIATVTDNGSVDTELLVTDATDWWAFTLDPVDGVAPSLTPGEILLELHGQAESRGVDTWAAIDPTFTATSDTDSTAWGVREERAWRIGYDTYLDMIEGLGDLGVDIEITPDLDLNAYYDRGTDLSATVEVEALVDVDRITESGVGVGATWLAVETQDGWVPNGLTNAAALAAYGRREAALSLGNAPSVAQGKRLGTRVLDERLSQPTSEWSVEFYASAGATPFEDFHLGDTIAVTIDGTTVDRVVLEIGGSAESQAAIIRWTIKTGAVL